MPFPHPLQYPKVIQKVQNRRNNRARRCGAHRDFSRDGEPTPLLRVDVDERRDQACYRIQKPDSVMTTTLVTSPIFLRKNHKEETKKKKGGERTSSHTEKSY